MDVTSDPPETHGPSVADRLFEVLECCSRSARPLSLVDLVERTGLPKTTLHRTCWKLVELGALERHANGFRIGTRLFALGSMSPTVRRLRVIGMPHLHELVARTGRVANLAVLSDRRALLVEEVFGARGPQMAKMVGATMPLHATAVGKALLMRQPAELLEGILDGNRLLRPYTGRTIVRPELLREHLEDARRAGYVMSREEWRVGTSAVAVPIVVGPRTVGAVALIGSIPESELRGLVQPLHAATQRIAGGLAPQPVPAPADAPAAA